MISKGFLVAAVFALAGCVARVEPGPSVSLGPEPALVAGQFTSGGGLVVAAELREVDGRAALCGVWARGPQAVMTRIRNRDVISTGSASVGGRVIAQNFTFMPEVSPRRTFEGASARCVLTRLDWEPGLSNADLVLRLPRQIVVNDSDGGIATGPGGGVIIRFREVPGFPPGF